MLICVLIGDQLIGNAVLNSQLVQLSVLDQLIDNGTYTEEFITASGGREMFLALPTTRNYLLYAKAGDTLIAIGGAYYEEGQREPLLNCMKIIAQTVSLTQE